MERAGQRAKGVMMPLFVLHKDGKLFRPTIEHVPYVFVDKVTAQRQAESFGAEVVPYFSPADLCETGRKIDMRFGGEGDDGQNLLDALYEDSGMLEPIVGVS